MSTKALHKFSLSGLIFLIFLPVTVNALDGTNSNSGNISFVDGTCQCPSATVGDTDVILGVTYTAVDNSTIAGEIANGNYNLCTTQVTYMAGLFSSNTSFNTDISFWDMSNVTNANQMFQGASNFNQDIGGWNTSRFYDVTYMFDSASSFNQDIGDWDTSNVANFGLGGMFNYASSFNQDLSAWCVSNITSEPGAFASNTSVLTEANKPIWGTCFTAGGNQAINNGLLRFGNGTENSIDASGNLKQPWYYNSDNTEWRKLTYTFRAT